MRLQVCSLAPGPYAKHKCSAGFCDTYYHNKTMWSLTQQYLCTSTAIKSVVILHKHHHQVCNPLQTLTKCVNTSEHHNKVSSTCAIPDHHNSKGKRRQGKWAEDQSSISSLQTHRWPIGTWKKSNQWPNNSLLFQAIHHPMPHSVKTKPWIA